MSRFQLIFTGILVLLGVGGAILFALAKNQGSGGAATVTLWGTADASVMTNFLAKAAVSHRDQVNVVYVKKDAENFESELISALARMQGPDMILLPQDLMLKQLDKFYVIPYENYSQRLFKDSFIQEGEMYLSGDGIVALPFSVDPLVMYWNRDIFTNAGLASPPSEWTEFFGLAPKLAKKDQNGNITQAMIAFGETRNVAHAKDMVSLLIMQAGSPLVAWDGSGWKSSLTDRGSSGLVPAEEAVSFFTEFSNPVKPSYTWNRSLSSDKAMFTAGKLAMYFGYGSEAASLRSANPNLDFDVAMVPQAAEGNRMTFGKMTGIAVLRSSPNVAPAFIAATALTGRELQALWAEESGYPPVRRDLLGNVPGDAFKAVLYKSALVSRAWHDPYREATAGTFMRMIEAVTSGRSRVSEAVNSASIELDNALRSNI